MNKKYILWGLTIVGFGATAFFVYKTIKTKKENEKLKKSLEELSEKYNVFK